MPITSFDNGTLNASTNGYRDTWEFFKIASVGPGGITGLYVTTWPGVGNPGPGAAPSAGSGTPGAGGTARTSAVGSMEFDDQSSYTKQLYGFEGQIRHTSGVIGHLMLLDRLVDIATISTASVANVNVNSVALPRYTDGVGVEMFLEVTTATTVTAPVLAAAYTDTANASQTSPSITFPNAAMPISSFLRIPWVAGGNSVKSIQTINVATASSAGVVTVVLAKVIADLPITALCWNFRDLAKTLPALPTIYDGASLFLAYQVSTASTPTAIEGCLSMQWALT